MLTCKIIVVLSHHQTRRYRQTLKTTIMKTQIENVKLVKKVNGHGQEIIQVFDTAAFNGVGEGIRIFTTLTSVTDSEIIDNINFEIDADAETRLGISKMVIALKNE